MTRQDAIILPTIAIATFVADNPPVGEADIGVLFAAFCISLVY